MNYQYQVKPMLKEMASLLQKHDEHLFQKKVRNHTADPIKSNIQTRDIFTEHKKPFPFSLSHATRKSEEQKFFLAKTGSKSSIMITNNSNVIPTTQIQGVRNRHIVGIKAL